MSAAELSCVYASMILHDEGLPITEDKIKALLEAAGVRAEPFWPRLFSRFLQGKNFGDLLSAAPAAGGAAAAAGAAPAAAAAAPAAAAGGKKEAKKEEKEEEEEEMGFGLFD